MIISNKAGKCNGLNPHFLFNSLHAIQGTVNGNNSSEANNYISDIASFMRNGID
ncbi:histidine kinase [Niastella vici]|nr:histidine kinase [Niastella vici]